MAEEHLKAIKNDPLHVCSALCVVEIPFHEGKFYDAQDTVKELSLTELTWPLAEHHWHRLKSNSIFHSRAWKWRASLREQTSGELEKEVTSDGYGCEACRIQEDEILSLYSPVVLSQALVNGECSDQRKDLEILSDF